MDTEFQIFPDHLLVTSSGRFNFAESKANYDEIARLCDHHQLSKVLVDGRAMLDEPSIAERFELGEYLTRGRMRPIRIAVLSPTKHISHTRALQNTANNRGGQVLTTDSEAAARAFLGID